MSIFGAIFLSTPKTRETTLVRIVMALHRTEKSSSLLPNALKAWDQLRSRLSESALAIFLDYDGTLSPIVSEPQKAIISPETRSCVQKVSEKFVTSVVTGRNMQTITGFMALENLHYAASHGFAIRMNFSSKKGDFTEEFIGSEYVEELSSFGQTVKGAIDQGKFPGASIEDNQFSVSIHYRNVQEGSNTTETLERLVDESLSIYKGRLRKTHGKKVFEIRPNIDWNKGKAVHFLLKRLESIGKIPSDRHVNIYLGDDVTDEDAFKVLDPSKDILILVTEEERPTFSNYTLNGPDQVRQFLELLSSL